MPCALSVIIPTLNEARCLPALLDDLSGQQGVDCELLVCDGGSHDATTALARAAGARVVAGPPGRGQQMNRGAAQAGHAWLLFLHADSRLTVPDQLARALAAVSADPTRQGRIVGHFPLSFDAPAKRSARLYRHMARKTRLNRPGTINGDQGVLIHRDFFAALGGFDTSLPFLEDQRLARQVFAQGEWRLLPDPLRTSIRRFAAEGAAQRYFLMMLIMCAEHAGLDEFLASPAGHYAAQDATGRLLIAPRLRQILALGERQPGFWRQMAEFTLDNAWQLFFALDGLGENPRCLSAYDRLLAGWLAGRLPRRLLVPMLAPVLAGLFRGPVLHYWQRRDQKV